MEYTFEGKENAIAMQHLQNSEICKLTRYGQSMVPLIKSGQSVIVVPIEEETELKKNDIVFCKVNGHFYLHKISAIKNKNSYQISNNHGHINGTVSRKNIFGKVVEILK